MGEFDDPKNIRDAPLPRGFRGFDEDATRELLGRIARAHQSALAEAERLRRQLEEQQSSENGAQRPSSPNQEASAMTEVLLIAKRTADQLLHDATEKAESLTASTERERAQILQGAAAEAAARSAALKAEIESLQHERDSLRATIANERSSFVLLLEDSLQRLDAVSEQLDLPDALRSRVLPDSAA